MERDPVCGMNVDPAKAAAKVDHGGKTYYFCAPGCARKFQQAPEKYLQPQKAQPSFVGLTYPHTATRSSAAAAKPAKYQHQESSAALDGKKVESLRDVQKPSASDQQARYTCPMHPEIVRNSPGACPICGMALESMDVLPDVEADPEYDSMRLRFWVTAMLSAPLLILAMFGESLGLRLTPTLLHIIELALATPVVLWGGAPFFRRFWSSLVHRSPNMFTLIGLGTGAAYLDSLIATLFPEIFPPSFRDMHGAVPVYFEAAAVITTLVLLGQVLELRARQRTSGAIRALLNLAPQQAHKVASEGIEKDIPLSDVRRGDQLQVRPGERVPVDGTILEGTSAIDESMMTGEAMPVEKSVGDKVIGGTLNSSGSFVMQAERVGSETTLAQIVKLVSEAQRSRAPMQRLADKVAAYFVPAVIAVAVLAFAGWMLLGPGPRFAHALVAAVSVLIIACPCALGLATPMSIMVAIGRGAHVGVLIRNAEALEMLARVDTLVLDKTGTLTEGKPLVTQINVFAGSGFTEDSLLAVAASLERSSEHPLARAIVSAAQEKRLPFSIASDFRAVSGQGVTGIVCGQQAIAGTASFLREQGIELPAGVSSLEGQKDSAAASTVYLAIDRHPVGVILLSDRIKPSAAEAIKSLRADGLRLVLLTGDRRAVAAQVASQLGIENVNAEVRPQQKSEAVKRLRQEGRVVAMAGDGINDAPALAAADVGIAMGTGTDVAIENAGITLLKGDLRAIMRARRLSRATVTNIRQNLAFAFLYNSLGIPIAAGLLYPFLGWLLSPMLASAAMSFSSVSVIANALRLRKAAL